MLRRVFTLLSALSLLLCIGTAMMWARSYFVRDELYWGNMWITGAQNPYRDYRAILFPYWVPLLPCIFAAYMSRRALRNQRCKAGHCNACGYDLRATPDRCPECGRVPTGAKT
jgi:hypothetical protein